MVVILALAYTFMCRRDSCGFRDFYACSVSSAHHRMWKVDKSKLLLLTPSLLLLLLLLLRLLLPSFISFRMVQYTGHTKIVPESLETESRASHPNIFLVSQLSMKIV